MLQPKVTKLSITKAMWAAVSDPRVRQAVVFQSPDLTVKVTRQRKPDGRINSETFIVTIGSPAAREEDFINKCQAAGEPFPVKKVGLRWYPSK